MIIAFTRKINGVDMSFVKASKSKALVRNTDPLSAFAESAMLKGETIDDFTEVEKPNEENFEEVDESEVLKSEEDDSK